MTLRVHEAARAEAVASAAYYESQGAGLGVLFTQFVQEAFRLIEDHSYCYAQLESMRVQGDVRRCPLRKSPHLIIDEVLDDSVDVLAVAHASRDPGYWTDGRHGQP